jgi:hypothetical protein
VLDILFSMVELDQNEEVALCHCGPILDFLESSTVHSSLVHLETTILNHDTFLVFNKNSSVLHSVFMAQG